MSTTDYKICKYCTERLEDCLDEGFTCTSCSESVHLRCLKAGTPGGFYGDIFFVFTCQECSNTGSEIYTREKMSWLKVLVLVLYHLQSRSPGLGRKGYFHWRNHVASLIDKNWETLFLKDFKKKKKWVGTVAGTLSHFSAYFFKSGTSVVNEPAWWALTYPKLTPNVISNLYSTFTNEKQRSKLLKISISDSELFTQILHKHVDNEDLLTAVFTRETSFEFIDDAIDDEGKKGSKQINYNKRKSLLPTFDCTSKKLLKLKKNCGILSNLGDDLSPSYLKNNDTKSDGSDSSLGSKIFEQNKESVKLLDPYCHYNTSLSSLSKQKATQMKARLMGGVRKELILSPYSSIYLKPYIRRDTETFPAWLRLMTEIQVKANEKNEEFVLPPRAPIDYTYVQPEHIPAINSLCNNYFWAGIDMTECLQYPDFSCVVMYKKLIVGFAFLVPNVKYTENYVSFIFTRPGWRNVGIGKFMLYHLIQTSLGKDITLHVSINNPALFLYQKFGFKVESVVLGFYDKYIRNEVSESKHAFFCRLER